MSIAIVAAKWYVFGLIAFVAVVFVAGGAKYEMYNKSSKVAIIAPRKNFSSEMTAR